MSSLQAHNISSWVEADYPLFCTYLLVGGVEMVEGGLIMDGGVLILDGGVLLNGGVMPSFGVLSLDEGWPTILKEFNSNPIIIKYKKLGRGDLALQTYACSISFRMINWKIEQLRPFPGN